MSLAVQGIRSAAAGLLIALSACGGGGGDGGGETGTPPASAVVGPAGGTVIGPNGAKVEIPPGALGSATTITIEQTSAGSPSLPAGLSVAGEMFAFTPHGTTFAVPVTVTIPFGPASVLPGTTPLLYKTNAQNQWEQVIDATSGTGTVAAQVTNFSHTTAVLPPVQRNEPTREWDFRVISGNGLNETRLPPPDGTGTQTGGVLSRGIKFGPIAFDVPVLKDGVVQETDGLAEGRVFSSASGITYGVFTEAPFVEPGGSEPIGSVSHLRQTQTFIKRANNASLSFTVTSVILRTVDFKPTSDLDIQLGLDMDALAILSVSAFHGPEAPPGTNPSEFAPGGNFYYAAANATLRGSNGRWFPTAEDYAISRRHLWSMDNFDLSTGPVFMAPDGTIAGEPIPGGCQGTTAMLVLKAPRTYHIDLSSVPLHGKFALYINADVAATNRRGGGSIGDCEGSSVSAYLRDPLETGGTTLTIQGLEATNEIPPPEPATALLVEPAACTSGPAPNPAAGTLQFSAASYRIGEVLRAPQTIRVTRSGGSQGDVTATFTTSDGSAVGGTDYTPVHATVFFADGDSAPRLIEVPIIGNTLDTPDKTVNLALSQPGGCAALGAITTAVLTILDDDEPPPISLPTGIDTSFGNAGKATLERFGGDRSGMALQADGKIVMVGGTFTDFILARFNADGSIDRSFGIDGKVTTDMGGGLRPEEALAVAIQGDGKIVVAGYTGIDATPPAQDPPPTFAIARYLSDGSLDTGFGTGGRVSGNVNGIARAVAIQPDGKIVLAGDFELELSNGSFVSDFVVARFNANGSLDLPFGTSGTGQVATDVGGVANSGRNLVLQPNGAIVVSGTPQCGAAGCGQTDIVRYNANGTLDASFGNGGKVTLSGVDVGQGLVRQADGKLVLVGTLVQPVAPATSRFMLVRLDAAGNADPSFGTAGTASTALSENAAAGGLALRADGKLVVVGTRALSPNPNFIVARYNGDGSLDTGFANAGALSIDFFGFDDAGENVLVQPDGRIVVGGLARNNVDGYGLARINP